MSSTFFQLPFVVNDKVDKEPTFWLPIYRNWLEGSCI